MNNLDMTPHTHGEPGDPPMPDYDSGQTVNWDQPDYLYRRRVARDQEQWEAYWFRPTADPTKLQVQQTVRDLEDAALRTANAIEQGWLSPRAMQRLLTVMRQWFHDDPPRVWPSNPLDRANMEASLRRVAESAGHDYDALYADDERFAALPEDEQRAEMGLPPYREP